MVMRYRRTPLGVLVNIFEGLGDFDIDRPRPNLYVKKKKIEITGPILLRSRQTGSLGRPRHVIASGGSLNRPSSGLRGSWHSVADGHAGPAHSAVLCYLRAADRTERTACRCARGNSLACRGHTCQCPVGHRRTKGVN